MKHALNFNQYKRLQKDSIQALVAMSLLISPHIKADESLSYQSGITLIHQHSFNKQIKPDTSLSADLGLYYTTQQGQWHLHLEASTAPSKNGVAAQIIDSNADAGSSLNNRDQGRIQVSELHYLFRATKHLQLTTGLLDATSYLDTANIMNDENQNFISPSLVNNPVIDFPDYVIGVSMAYQLTAKLTSRLFVSSTHGLADNNSRNYSSLFEVNEDEKGIFSAFELGYAVNQSFINIGVWLHSGQHQALDDSNNNDLSNYGSYLSTGLSKDNHQYEMRFGIANPDVSAASQFVSAAYQYSTEDWDLGVGLSSTALSSKLQNDATSPAQTAELYWQRRLNKNWQITPSVQWFKNPFYESTSQALSDEVMTANLRISYAFE